MKKVFTSPLIRLTGFFLVFYVLSIPDSFAGHAITHKRMSGTEIAPGVEFTVSDDKYNDMVNNPEWDQQFTNYKIINRFTLSVDKESKRFQPQDYEVKVSFLVTSFQYNPASHLFDSVQNIHSLKVSYGSGSNYNDKSLLKFEGGSRIKVKILSVDPNPVSAIMNLAMDAEVDVERYYTLDVNAFLGSDKVNYNADYVLQDGELEIDWDSIPAAEEYDLEWTYVSNLDGDGGTLPDNEVTIDKDIFKYNSTRVTIARTSYRIPLVYEAGYLLYRVRAVGRSKESDFKEKKYSEWSYNGNCTDLGCVNDKYYFAGHEKIKNWQFSANYAEEGKSKVAVSYFDGSLRNRQVVSRLNTENKAIIGETIYDYQGRGAIQVLPVPVGKSKIQYYPDFNVNSSRNPYSKFDFDLDDNATGNGCFVKAGGMDSISGASNYYSFSNPDKEGHQSYLPKASGYPFTQTLYTRDNTGRIRSQTGVGPYYQLGTGHETKYYYGSPQQEELDRLFGSEVGDAVRYKKNMVEDANGQISVSYLDPQGKVIATALAGVKPDNLEALPDYNEKDFQVDLLNKTSSTDQTGSLNLLSLDKRSLVYNKQILVSSPGPRTFTYTVRPVAVPLGCMIGDISGTFCSSSVLDLSLSLTNECGYNFLTGVSNKTIGSFNLSCSVPLSFNKTWSNIDLEPGAYTLTKNLSINQDALDRYTEEYFKTNECVLKLSDFLADEMARIDTLACIMTCEECRKRIGIYEWNVNPYNKDFNPDCDPCFSESEYKGLLAGCDEYCDDKSIDCSSAYEAMLADISPMGQYGEFLVQSINGDNATIDSTGQVTPELGGGEDLIRPDQFPLSVFNEKNRLPVKHGVYLKRGDFYPSWKFPYYVDSMGMEHYVYMESDKDTSFIRIQFSGIVDGKKEFTPSILPGKEIMDQDSNYRVLPGNLANIKDFIANWKEYWSRSLVRYHPEYAYYDYCLKQSASNDFDDQWLSTSTLQDAIDKGYLNTQTFLPNPLGSSPADAFDPYFRNIPSNTLFSNNEYLSMKYFMQHYSTTDSKSIWEMANLSANCPFANSENGCLFENCSDKKIDSDNEWNLFKGYYISLKQKFQKVKSNQYAIQTECYNGCIGTDKFNPYDYNFFNTTYSFRNAFLRPSVFRFFRSQFFNWEQPCNYWNYKLYKGKAKRFSFYDGANSQKEESPKICYNPLQNVGDTLVEVECPEEASQITKDYEEEIDREIYNECGQCPLARDLEVLLNAIAKRKELTKNFPLSCYPQSNYPEFITDLSVLIPGTGSVNWNIISQSGKRVDVRFFRSGGGGTLTLLLPDTAVFTFDDISRICCLTYSRTGIRLPQNAGKNFICKGDVVIPATGDIPEHTVVLTIEGVTSCINVGECNIPPKCTVSEEGKKLQTFLNFLLYSASEKQNEFTKSHVSLATSNPIPYEIFIKDLYNFPQDTVLDNSWWWNKAPGYPQYLGRTMRTAITNAYGSCIIDFYLPETPVFSFNNIVSFSSLRPDPDITKHEIDGSVYNFLITTLISDGTNKQYVTISGKASCFKAGTCEYPVRPVTNP